MAPAFFQCIRQEETARPEPFGSTGLGVSGIDTGHTVLIPSEYNIIISFLQSHLKHHK